MQLPVSREVAQSLGQLSLARVERRLRPASYWSSSLHNYLTAVDPTRPLSDVAPFDVSVATDETLCTPDRLHLSPAERAVLGVSLLEYFEHVGVAGNSRVHPTVADALVNVAPAIEQLDPSALQAILSVIKGLLAEAKKHQLDDDERTLLLIAEQVISAHLGRVADAPPEIQSMVVSLVSDPLSPQARLLPELGAWLQADLRAPAELKQAVRRGCLAPT